jgi:hypothetical protein
MGLSTGAAEDSTDMEAEKRRTGHESYIRSIAVGKRKIKKAKIFEYGCSRGSIERRNYAQ